MRHPLLKSHPEVRKRMITLLREGLLIRRAGNLIFICGGNDNHHLRPKFIDFLAHHGAEFTAFMPEFAMKNYFSEEDGAQLDLGEFEELIGELSHAIVIFPEAPGSYAETGYFSQTPALSSKSILVLDLQHQSNDSFIMMGPARRFEQYSKFNPNVQIDFKDPDFNVILDRINRFDIPKYRKAIELEDGVELSSYDLFCIVYKIFDLLIIATMEDLNAVFNSLFSGHAPRKRIRDIASILVGAGFLQSVGEFGHYSCLSLGDGLVQIRDGMAGNELALKLEIAEIIRDSSNEFAQLLMERADAN